MTTSIDTPALRTINKKALKQAFIKISAIPTSVSTILAGSILAISSAYAAPEIAVSPSAAGSTTVTEQYSDGKTAVITATLQLPVINAPTTTVVTNQPATTKIVSTSLDALQLTPTFSTPGIVNAQTKVMKILKNKDGREVAVPANHVAPGDVIEYHTTYTNTTAQPINDINAMVSLPSGVQLVSLNSPIPTLATTDGDSYQTIQQIGNTVVVKENYSGLKWNLVDLSPKAAQTVIIRAKVQ